MANNSKHTGLGIALGAVLGTILGMMAGHVALWLGLGAAIGVAIGGTMRFRRTKCPHCEAAKRDRLSARS